MSEEQKRKIGDANCGRPRLDMQGDGNPMRRPEVREKKRTIWKQLIQDPVFREKWFPGCAGQNKIEKLLQAFLDQYFPDQWQFVGNNQRIGNRCPDFIHTTRPLLIELFGDHWHGKPMTGVPKLLHEWDRVSVFRDSGYETLVIWEHELKHMEAVLQKVWDFLTYGIRKKRVYYGSPIRGSQGDNATPEYMAANCIQAKKNIDVLEIVYPDIQWISVAPYDRIVQKLLAKGYVSIHHVLEADFELGDSCDGLLAHFWEPSGGAQEEIERQESRGKVTLGLRECPKEIWRCDWEEVDRFVNSLLYGSCGQVLESVIDLNP